GPATSSGCCSSWPELQGWRPPHDLHRACKRVAWPWRGLGPTPEEDEMSDQIQAWPLVKRGSHGHPVPALQYLLRDRGHHVTVDGIFGPKTEAAVEQFQIADQLRVDGIV